MTLDIYGNYLKQMIKKIFNYKLFLLLILILIVLEPSITSWLVIWLQDLYNNVSLGMPKSEIISLILLGVFVWMIKRVVVYLISIIKSYFICNLKIDIKNEMFKSIFNYNFSNLSRIAKSGEYISIFTNDISLIENKYFSNIISIFASSISILILSANFINMNIKLASIVIIFSLFAISIPLIFNKKLNDSSLIYSTSLSKFTQKIKEFIGFYPTIKNYSIENIINSKFKEINIESEKTKFYYDNSISIADCIGSLFTWFSGIMVIGCGLILYSKSEIGIGTIVAANAFTTELGNPLQSLVESFNSIKSINSIVNKIDNITNIDSEINDIEMNLSDNGKLYDIEFKDFCISGNSKYIIKDFNFTFKSGNKYLIIGENGAGKSSLFKALKHGFNKYSGEIKLGNVEINKLSTNKINEFVSYLNENVSIFSGSVEENIKLWRNISSDLYRKALYDTKIDFDNRKVIDENGNNISSGEQRKIEIARSLVLDSKIMIFDEVVSTLDIKTAYDIENMALGFKDKTIIFVSHNFSGKLIKKYDEILILNDGKLVDHGNFNYLIKNNSYFKEICEIKFGRDLL